MLFCYFFQNGRRVQDGRHIHIWRWFYAAFRFKRCNADPHMKIYHIVHLSSQLPIFCRSFWCCFLHHRINKYKTRSSNNLYVPFYRYQVSRSTIRFIGPKVWNTVDTFLKQSPSLSSFKKRFKLQLIGNHHQNIIS